MPMLVVIASVVEDGDKVIKLAVQDCGGRVDKTPKSTLLTGLPDPNPPGQLKDIAS